MRVRFRHHLAMPFMKFRSLFATKLNQAGFALHPNSACGLYFFQSKREGYYHALVINSSGTVDRKSYAYSVIAFINYEVVSQPFDDGEQAG